MKLKLVESGSFTGKKRVAELDLSGYPQKLVTQLKNAFNEKVSGKQVDSLSRDKEQLFLEFENQVRPLNEIPLSEEMKSLVEDLKSKLNWEK
jgi:hypothetical protein